jgi:hypothetical protein
MVGGWRGVLSRNFFLGLFQRRWIGGCGRGGRKALARIELDRIGEQSERKGKGKDRR